jgi:hypothetical protein
MVLELFHVYKGMGQAHLTGVLDDSYMSKMNIIRIVVFWVMILCYAVGG